MANFPDKKLIPFPILSMLITIGMLSVLMVFNLPPMSAYERDLLKGFILCLLLIVGAYFIFRKPLAHIKQKIIDKSGNKGLAEDSALVPDGFNLELVKDKGFAFCYPKTWFLTAASDPVLYKEVREQIVEPGILGARNFNISCHDIRRAPDMDKMYQAIIDGVLTALKGSRLEFKQNFKTSQVLGMRYKVVYKNLQGLNLSCYQIVLTSHRKKNMLIFTFTSQINDFDKSKALFDQIAGLAKIFD